MRLSAYPGRVVRAAAAVAAFVLPAVAATACEKDDSPFGLEGLADRIAVVESWRALEVDGLMPDTVPGVRDGRFRFQRWRDTVGVGWYVGCNGWGANFEARGDSLRFMIAFGTYLGCSARMFELDARIHDALAASTRYLRRDSLVTFLDANGSTRIRFRVLPDTMPPYGMTPYVPPAP
ncbi:MAG: META domain-containing protein [Gemmatimonadaceae bacterium]